MCKFIHSIMALRCTWWKSLLVSAGVPKAWQCGAMLWPASSSSLPPRASPSSWMSYRSSQKSRMASFSATRMARSSPTEQLKACRKPLARAVGSGRFGCTQMRTACARPLLRGCTWRWTSICAENYLLKYSIWRSLTEELVQLWVNFLSEEDQENFVCCMVVLVVCLSIALPCTSTSCIKGVQRHKQFLWTMYTASWAFIVCFGVLSYSLYISVFSW